MKLQRQQTTFTSLILSSSIASSLTVHITHSEQTSFGISFQLKLLPASPIELMPYYGTLCSLMTDQSKTVILVIRSVGRWAHIPSPFDVDVYGTFEPWTAFAECQMMSNDVSVCVCV